MALISQGTGKVDEAADHIKQAVASDPANPVFHFSQGSINRALGRTDQALTSYRIAATLKPDFLDARLNLANILLERGRGLESLDHYRFVLDRGGDAPQVRLNYATALKLAGRMDEAEEQFRTLVDHHPDYPEGHANLGLVLCARSRGHEAMTHLKRALSLKPNFASAQNGIGLALVNLGRGEEAEEAYRRAIAMDPTHVDARGNLASLLHRRGRLDEAIAEGRELIRLAPGRANAYNNLAMALTARGEIAEARATFEKALALDPNNAETHSNALMCLCYDAEATPEEVAAAHRAWADRFAPTKETPPLANPDPERILKVGYVSPDFRFHSVAYFAAPIIAAHDRTKVEVFCYADLAVREDSMTALIKERADHWRDITGKDADEVAAAIQADGIDLLVDLAGHTANNRLQVFARRPAPLQVTWIGYPNTTGLAAMDARFTDAEADPPGHTEAWHSEDLIRLPTGFLCYRPPNDSPAIAPPPVLETGQITFGSFNNLAKLNTAVAKTWAGVLKAVPDSRLLLKARPLEDEGSRIRVQTLFAEQGITPERLDLIGFIDSPKGHLDLYKRIDIALDPFPYNGTTTTCEALWMGVPVVTLAGEVHAGRVGVSLLTRVGLEKLIAGNTEDYASLAADLAGNLSALVEMRASLREKMAASPLTNARAVTAAVEDAYRALWRAKVAAP